MELGQKIYYLHPTMGLIGRGEDINWEECLFEVREGFYVEVSDKYCGGMLKIKQGNNYSGITEIPENLVATTKREAERKLEIKTKENWKHIFSRIMDMQESIVTLKKQINKIKEI